MTLTKIFSQLAGGMWISIQIFFVTLIFSLPLGLFISFGRMSKNPVIRRLNSDKVLFSIARGRERCDRNGHAVFLRPGVDFATTSSETTGISTSSTKLK